MRVLPDEALDRVKCFWHPLSTILLSEPRCFATDHLVRLLLGAEPLLKLIYSGDRMWPAVDHESEIVVEPVRDDLRKPGEVLLVSRDGIPDLLRVREATERSLTLTADAEPDAALEIPHDAVLARACLPHASSERWRAGLRRLGLELREAWRARPDDHGDDPAATVRDKYESQAALYKRARTADIDPRLLERIRERIPAGRAVLVVGSGVGRESFAVAAAGMRVLGVEFSPTMVSLALEEVERRGLDVDFRQIDVREMELPEGRLGGVVFTYDVFSFLPKRRERVELLCRLRSWLRPDGVVFLSSRRLLSLYDRMILSLQWLALQRSGEAEWGDSHTRWIPNDGRMRRSFVHVFSMRQLHSETSAAGFLMEPWEAGHCVLTPDTATMGDA